jgi:alpha-N-arabinofuranosidase
MKGQALQVQGTGHGDFVQTPDGHWWVVFLAYRNFGGSYHHLGRETYLAPVEWKEGEWPVVNGGEPVDTIINSQFTIHNSKLANANYDLTKHHLPFEATPSAPVQRSYTFDQPLTGPEWIHIQNPIAENYRYEKGRLLLKGHGTLTQNDQPTFIGQRQCSERLVAETDIDLTTLKADGTAPLRGGLTVYQIHDGHFDFYTDGREVHVACKLKTIDARVDAPGRTATLRQGAKVLRLRVTSDGNLYRFAYAVDGGDFVELAAQSCTLVSTEVAGGFTGVTIGLFSEGGTVGFMGYSHREG